MNISVTFHSRKFDEMQRKFTAFASDQRKFKLFKKLAVLLKKWWNEVFQRQGARSGHPRWKPLSPKYAAWKLSHGGGSKILQFIGTMKGSFRVLSEDSNSLRAGPTDEKAEFHQLGMGRNPKREMTFITKEDEKEIAALVASIIEDNLK